MASAAPSSMEEHLTCCICWNTFEDPVTTDCGHSFCKKCLESSSKCGRGSCPICKKPLSRIPEVNIVLRDIVQQQELEKREEDIYTADGGGLNHGHPFEVYDGKQIRISLLYTDGNPKRVVPAEKKKSLHVCQVCGWSKMTTFHGLRIHQGKMGCTPKGQKSEQHDWPILPEVKTDRTSRLKFKEEKSPSRKTCISSAAASAPLTAGYNPTFPASQSSFQRATKTKPAHQPQDSSTLPRVNRKPAIPLKPVVRPKEEKMTHQMLPRMADSRRMKRNERVTAASVKEEPGSPAPITRLPSQTHMYPQLQDSSAAAQVHGLALKPPSTPQKRDNKHNMKRATVNLGNLQKIQPSEDRRRPVRAAERVCEITPDPAGTSSRAHSGPETSTNKDPTSHCETAESDLPADPKVKELAQKFSAAAAQPEQGHKETQVRPLAAQGAAVRPEEKDGEERKPSTTVPDSSRADEANDAAYNPRSLDETTQPDFSAGMKVKDLARMFSAKTIQETAAQANQRHVFQARLLGRKSSATAAERAAVQPKTTADSATRMNPAAAEDDPEAAPEAAELPDFPAGRTVKELARMFTSTLGRTIQPRRKH
ncbi:uncharacterized protein LOC115058875 [Echeneis naucrates]|uniref:uncharacterized protein LOC115058875 n=1 Tax=Echeneis naucrates TaxID=173247 RepID=UPI00111429D0|nr:uncharacterized protein LOC115058875 [Echeneis naucrates]